MPGLDDPRQALRDIGLLVIVDGAECIRKEDEHNVPRFLNRILALEVKEQNALFDYFAELFDQTVRYAKSSGTFDEGVTDIKALAIRVAKPPAVVHRDHVTGAETVLYTLEVDRPSDKVSFDRADRLRSFQHGAFFRHQTRGDFILALQSGRHTDPNDGKTFSTYSIWKPGGSRTSYIREQDLNSKYLVISPSEVRAWWVRQHARVPEIETHEVHIVAGAIIPLWQKLKTKDDARLRVVRVSTQDGQRIVGVEIPRTQVGQVLRALGLKGPILSPEQVFHELLDGNGPLTLTADMRLKKSIVQREVTVELECHDPDRFQELRNLGLINEQIAYKQRFFVPSDEAKGLPILIELLARYPLEGEQSPDCEDSQQETLPVEVPATESTIVDLANWVLPPKETARRDGTAPANQCRAPETGAIGQPGPSWLALLEQRGTVPKRGHRRPQLPVEEQSALFTLTE